MCRKYYVCAKKNPIKFEFCTFIHVTKLAGFLREQKNQFNIDYFTSQLLIEGR